jgi:hypothetical protein
MHKLQQKNPQVEDTDNYNNERTHQGKMCNGRTPMETLLSGKLIWDEKNLNQI